MDPDQMDRIEQKLDDVLAGLDEFRALAKKLASIDIPAPFARMLGIG